MKASLLFTRRKINFVTRVLVSKGGSRYKGVKYASYREKNPFTGEIPGEAGGKDISNGGKRVIGVNARKGRRFIVEKTH